MSAKSNVVHLDGCQHFRQRLVLSTLSGKAMHIDSIRSDDQHPGLREYEASLLRLFEKISNGCKIEINETGTRLRYKPGFVTNADSSGHSVVHDCGTSRSIGYFLEPLCVVALFGKYPLSITLRGITNDAVDVGVDMWRTVTLPLLRQIVGSHGDDSSIQGSFELKIVKRGSSPLGGGEIQLKVPIIRKKTIPPISMLEEGLVKRVRGIAYATKVSPQTTNRVVDGARGVLNSLLPDVYIFTDHMGGKDGGESPGYGVLLVAETTSGRMLGAEAVMVPGDGEQQVPEDVGRDAAYMLLEEVSKGGVVDTSHQGLILLMCALGPEEINEVRLGPLTPYAVKTLRHIKEFLGVQFSVRPENTSGTIFLSCIGAGITNLSKRIQ
jgi:RNA 3'-terminal phosphate cyclase-like protein